VLGEAKVLIVCTKPERAQRLAKVVEDNHGRAFVATTSTQAIAMATSEVPRLVVMREDDNRSELVGLCRRMRQTPGITDLPILVVVSGENLAGSAIYVEAGATEVVPAPGGPSEMVLKIFSVMRMHELKGELDWLYHRLHDIGKFTANLSKEFNPAYLDFSTLIEELMSSLLLPAAGDSSTPRRILTFNRSSRGRWHVGAFFLDSSGHLHSIPELTVIEEEVLNQLNLPKYELLALNQGEALFNEMLRDGLWAAVDQPPPKTNMVSFWSKELGAVATDFPGRVYPYHARAMSCLGALSLPQDHKHPAGRAGRGFHLHH